MFPQHKSDVRGATRQALATIPEVIALHDRTIPGVRSRIDHIVVAPTGVWVIDSRCYADQVVRFEGTGVQVGGLDAGPLLAAVARRTNIVRVAACAVLGTAPVRPVLCLEEARWAEASSPRSVGPVSVARPADLAGLVGAEGGIGIHARRRIAAVIGHGLPAHEPRPATLEAVRDVPSGAPWDC